MLDVDYAVDENLQRLQIMEVRQHNKQLACNYWDYLNYYLNRYNVDLLSLATDIINTRIWVKDYYSLQCFNPEKFLTTGYTYGDLDNYFRWNNREWEFKRGLGLFLEHSLVYIFRNLYIPAYNTKLNGSLAFDFIYVDNGYFYPIDLKINFGSMGKIHRNVSVFNLNVLLTLEDIVDVFQTIKDNNFSEFRFIISKINDTIVSASKERNKIYTINRNEKSSNDWPSLKLQQISV